MKQIMFWVVSVGLMVTWLSMMNMMIYILLETWKEAGTFHRVLFSSAIVACYIGLLNV